MKGGPGFVVSRVGEPPVWTVLPSTIAAPSVWYVPAALATPGTPWICASIVVFSVCGVVPVLSIAVNAVLGDTCTAVPLNDVLKMSAKPLWIWSVSTYVPVIIATPSRIARTVRTVRSGRLARLRKARRVIGPPRGS